MSHPERERVEISASLMCADTSNLEDEVRQLEKAGVDLLHFDIMDAHFVPNLPLGLKLLADLRPKTSLRFDVHLMVEDTDFFARQVLPLGVDRVAVHAESARHLDRTLDLLRQGGVRAGVALNPHTGPGVLDYVLERLDFVLVMTVNPGFSGQELVPAALRKIADCREHLESRGRRVPIAVDGCVNFEVLADMVAAGADVLIGGSSSLYDSSGSRLDNARRMRDEAARGLALRAGGGRIAAPSRPAAAPKRSGGAARRAGGA